MQITPQATAAKPQSIDENNAKLVAAMRAKEQREQGLRGQAKREGREEREREILQQAGVAAIDEISMLAQIRAEHDAEKRQIELRWFREEQKHGRGEYWKGWAHSAVVMGALMSAGMMFYALTIVSSTLEAAVPMRAQESIVDEIRNERALERQRGEPQRIAPSAPAPAPLEPAER